MIGEHNFIINCEMANADRKQLDFILLVCGANFFVMLSYALNITFWQDHHTISSIVGFLYFIVLVVYLNSTSNPTLLATGLRRLKEWSEYNESKDSKPYKYQNYLKNGDYVYVKDKGYLRYMVSYKERIALGFRDITISLSRIDNGESIYSISKSFGYVSSLLGELDEQLKSDGAQIEIIYNEFGDEKWRVGQRDKKPSDKRGIIYMVCKKIRYVVYIGVSLAPLICFGKQSGLL